jgi:hypothetical protein
MATRTRVFPGELILSYYKSSVMQVLLYDGLRRKERQSEQQGHGGENVERLIVVRLPRPSLDIMTL